MTQAEVSGRAPGKGKVFFDRADQVADMGNWDFAIEMYLQGIEREPDNIERGHQPLRQVSLNRKMKGGKPAGLMEQMKRKGGKDPVAALVNAEYLLAKDPGSTGHMEGLLRAAQKAQLPTIVKWILDIMLEAQRLAAKRDKRALVTIIEAFAAIEDYKCALIACDMARELSPDDAKINDAASELSAKFAIKQGGYQDGSKKTFTDNVKNMDEQKRLIDQDSLSQSKDYRQQQIERAREEYLKTPTVPGKINGYVDALLKMEDEAFENEAIDVLAKAHKDTSAYQFKMRIGEVRITQARRQYQKLQKTADADKQRQMMTKVLELELQEFTERSQNYPTDLSIKFELGRRQFLSGKYDEAIASFQTASRDPRRHVAAMSYLGQAFARKGWYSDAADTFARALQAELPEERAKELRYAYGDVLEKMGDQEKDAAAKATAYKRANEELSRVAQVDFSYKDVRQRLEDVRKKLDQAEAAGA